MLHAARTRKLIEQRHAISDEIAYLHGSLGKLNATKEGNQSDLVCMQTC